MNAIEKHMTLLLLNMLALIASPSCASPSSHVSYPIVDGEVLSGRLDVDTLVIPLGFTVYAEADLEISARGLVRIEGRLIAFDADSLGTLDAPDIRITSPVVVDIPGSVMGGKGKCPGTEAKDGGQGSSIMIHAPITYIDGVVDAGPGGDGGYAHSGRRGGDARVEGYCIVRAWSATHFSLVGGRGGQPGLPGGDSGGSGDAIAEVPETVRLEIESIRPRAIEALHGYFTPAQGGGTTGTTAQVGQSGANSRSPNVAKAGKGENGSATSPNGKKGGNGRPSGAAAATDGLPGNPGGDMCEPGGIGGTGGQGGLGGTGTSGRGGDGGDGGDPYGGATPVANAGNGGDGGDSGAAKAGRGGNGGPGGKPNGLGGDSGATGARTSGAPGAGGAPGNGSGGSAGGPGAGGGETDGGGGMKGLTGAKCPT